MDEIDRRVFADLLNAVVLKGFGHPLHIPLSEPESRHLSQHIEESTGLVIGWRSIKNYAAFLTPAASTKPENPSIATLDTLARYVLGAPVTTEAERKRNEAHFPYWFRFREQAAPAKLPQRAVLIQRKPMKLLLGLVCLLVISVGGGIGLFLRKSSQENITDDFRDLDEASLRSRGWFVQAKNMPYWNRRAEKPNELTLFTLKGDNWQQTGVIPRIQNLLLRSITSECFRTEMHLEQFIPTANWQQAGLVLLEDTTFRGKSIRLSIAYNDFFGGYRRPGEILIQAISSYGTGHVEEFIHQSLFQLDPVTDQRIVDANLKHFAFRVEKRGTKFRILYSASPVDNFSFKELITYEFAMQPNYVGLFALKGFVDSSTVKPVTVRYFQLDHQSCE